MINNTILVSTIEFEHLIFEGKSDEYSVSLVDSEGYKIIKGYGKTTIEAINDMHNNLI